MPACDPRLASAEGGVDAGVLGDATFRAFLFDDTATTESTLAKYDIADKAAERQLLTTLLQLDMLDAR
jgi:hypothetical protein